MMSNNPSGALRSAKPEVTIADVGDPVPMAMLQTMYEARYADDNEKGVAPWRSQTNKF